MNLKINKKIVLITFISIIFTMSFAGAVIINAEEGFVPLESEFFKAIGGDEAAKDPSIFFNKLFQFGIIIAGFLAVIMIAIGGITYMSTDSITGKGDGIKMINGALLGLLLILFSYILLKTINPDILKFNLFNKTNIDIPQPPTFTPTPTLTPTPTPIPQPPTPPVDPITDADKKYDADLQRWIKEQPDGAERAKEIEMWKKEFPSITTSDKQKLILFFAWKGY